MAYYRNTETGEKWVRDGFGSGRSYARMAVMFLVIFLLVALAESVYVVYFTGMFPCSGCAPPAAANAKANSSAKSKPHKHTRNELFDGTDQAMKQLGKLP